jgi:type I restriction enzyme S subunit
VNDVWRDVTLGEVFEISSSKRVHERDWKSSGVPFYRAREIVTLARERRVQNELFISDELYSKYRARYGVPNPGDLMVSAVGTLGACYVVQPGDRFYYKDASVLRFSPKQPVCSRFFQHAFRTQEVLDQVHAGSGSTVGTYTISRAKSTRISIPPLPEQRRIAAILDQAESLKRKRQCALKHLSVLQQAMFLEMFGDPILNNKGWPSHKLGQVGSVDRGVSKQRPRNDPTLLGGPYPFVQTGDVANSDGYIRRHESSYSEAGLRQSKMWPAGTLCITIAANIAKTAILIFPACFPDSVVGFQAQDPATVEFVRIWLSFVQQKLEATAPESAQKNINLAILRDLMVPIPPLDLQRTFAARLHALNTVKSSATKSLREIDVLFASLEHRAFRGEL